MAKRNLAAAVDEGMPETKTVEVLERHHYTKEVPIIEEATAAIVEDEQPDIFSTFNEIVSTNESALLRIWLLPKYDIDGRASIHATDREYCGSIPYNSDNAVLLDQIQGRVPMGGMVQLELFANGAIRKRGLLRLIKQTVPINSNYTPQGTHLVINQPQAPSPAQQSINPADMMREQMGLAKDLVAMAKDLAPAAPIVNVGEQQQSNSDKPLEERLFEAVALKALESDKVPIDRLLDALGGGGRHKEPSIMEGVLEILKAFAPTIDKVVQQVMAAQQRATMSAAGVSSAPGVQPAQLSGAQVDGSRIAPEGQGEPSQAVDPIARDWFQVIIRMLEDCTRHVELASVGGGGKSVLPSAEAVIELAERYPEQLGPTIQTLLTSEPIQVIDLCCMMLDERGQAHVNTVLRPAPATVEFIGLLQEECKRIIEDAKEQIEVDATSLGDVA